MVFFLKQKTAYEMRISEWSSDVCSSDLDMVINLGLAKAAEGRAVTDDIAAVRAGAPKPALLKVIIESGALTEDEIVRACQAAEEAGADYVKTSTGFHPAGGATVEAVALMAKTVGGRLGVKASGGLRDAATATRSEEHTTELQSLMRIS